MSYWLDIQGIAHLSCLLSPLYQVLLFICLYLQIKNYSPQSLYRAILYLPLLIMTTYEHDKRTFTYIQCTITCRTFMTLDLYMWAKIKPSLMILEDFLWVWKRTRHVWKNCDLVPAAPCSTIQNLLVNKVSLTYMYHM